MSEINSDKFQCTVCIKSFQTKRGFLVHYNKVHDKNKDNSTKAFKIKCQEMECDFVCQKTVQLRQHLYKSHGFNFVEMVKEFEDIKQFMFWLGKFEKRNNVEFFRASANNNVGCKVIYYRCNRSGFYKGKSKSVRKLKRHGSCKINGYCTAYIKVKVDYKSSSVTMTICNTHYGHSLEEKHLRIPKLDRNLITQKLSNGINIKDVCSEIKQNPNYNNGRQLSDKDIRNIAAKVVLHSKDTGFNVCITNKSVFCKGSIKNNFHIPSTSQNEVCNTSKIIENQTVKSTEKNNFYPSQISSNSKIMDSKESLILKLHDVINKLQLSKSASAKMVPSISSKASSLHFNVTSNLDDGNVTKNIDNLNNNSIPQLSGLQSYCIARQTDKMEKEVITKNQSTSDDLASSSALQTSEPSQQLVFKLPLYLATTKNVHDSCHLRSTIISVNVKNVVPHNYNLKSTSLSNTGILGIVRPKKLESNPTENNDAILIHDYQQNIVQHIDPNVLPAQASDAECLPSAASFSQSALIPCSDCSINPSLESVPFISSLPTNTDRHEVKPAVRESDPNISAVTEELGEAMDTSDSLQPLLGSCTPESNYEETFCLQEGNDILSQMLGSPLIDY